MLRVSNGKEHGLINTLVSRVPRTKRFKNVEPKKKEELTKKLEHDLQKVKVRYINYKNQENGFRLVPFRPAAGEPMQLWKFLHGESYEIPRGIVAMVNNPARKYKDRSGMMKNNHGLLDGGGEVLDKDSQPKSIDEFVPEW